MVKQFSLLASEYVRSFNFSCSQNYQYPISLEGNRICPKAQFFMFSKTSVSHISGRKQDLSEGSFFMFSKSLVAHIPGRKQNLSGDSISHVPKITSILYPWKETGSVRRFKFSRSQNYQYRISLEGNKDLSEGSISHVLKITSIPYPQKETGKYSIFL